MWNNTTNLIKIPLNNPEIKALVDSLFKFTSEKFPLSNHTVRIGEKIGLRKNKYTGTVNYYISSKDGFTYLTSKQVDMLKKAVYSFIYKAP